MKKNNIVFAFFGTSVFSVIILDELKAHGLVPALIVTVEDKPKDRKLIMTPPEVKIWAEKERVPFIQPKTLKNDEVAGIIKKYSPDGFDVFIVASYGKIIPENLLNIPRRGTLNIHPSLLPRLRGASPVQSAILNETETGVTIIKLDKEMDHGPILVQQKAHLNNWPPYAEDLEKILAKMGGKLLVEILPNWISGKTEEKEQNHSDATHSKKIEKSDGELNMNDSADENLRKIRAYHIWPGAYFFDTSRGKQKRIIVKTAHLTDENLILDRIIPEGKREMNYKDYVNGKK